MNFIQSLIKIIILLLSLTLFSPFASASTQHEMSLRVSLEDELHTRSEYITFDVWALINGNKADDEAVTVTNNGDMVPINWSDPAKTSYTATLTAGINELIIKVTHAQTTTQETFYIDYTPAAIGEVIGYYTFSMDAFVAGLGYLIEPQRLPIINGDNAAHHVKRALEQADFTFKHTGDIDNNFYLGTVFGGNLASKFDYVFPDAIVEAAYEHDFELQYDFEPSLGLGEFMFSGGSGWMYAINNEFPNVGFSDYYLLDGDVMRVQFTLNLGRDIGGGDPTLQSENFFPKVSKDALTTAIARIHETQQFAPILEQASLQSLYDEALALLHMVNPTEQALQQMTQRLDSAYISALNECIVHCVQKDDAFNQYMTHLSDEQRDRLTNLAKLDPQVAHFEQQLQQLPSNITLTSLTAVHQLRQQYEAFSDTQRYFVRPSVIQQLLAAEASLFDATVNTDPYKILPSHVVTDRQNALTITLSQPPDPTKIEESIVVRSSTYKMIPTKKVVEHNRITILPLQQRYRQDELYTITITQQLTNEQAQRLMEPVRMTFSVE